MAGLSGSTLPRTGSTVPLFCQLTHLVSFGGVNPPFKALPGPPSPTITSKCLQDADPSPRHQLSRCALSPLPGQSPPFKAGPATELPLQAARPRAWSFTALEPELLATGPVLISLSLC